MFYIGIDLGGTDIKTGIVNTEGKIISKAQCPTLANRDYTEVIKDMANCALSALENANLTINDIASVGIGIPGIAEEETGTVIFCTNLGWYDVPLKTEIQKYINKPVFINNDATVAGYAESVSGIAKGTSSSVFITLGTGVGSGIIINGKPWSGFHGIGSELGHIPLQIFDGNTCTCGNVGCLERYCSASAIIRFAREAVAENSNSLIMELANGNAQNINAKVVIDAAKQGDEVATKVFEKYVFCLCKAILSVINFIDPEVIVLGGGVSKAGDFLVDSINKEIKKYLLFKKMPYPKILIANLGADAGVIGAAMLGN